jgi:PII-like signaling protein
MNEFKEQLLLRIFTGESEKIGAVTAFEYIVKKAKEDGISGVIVLKGMMGFGSHRVIHSSKLLDLSTDLPVVIELVDSEEVIEKFISSLRTVMKSGTATLERVRVIKFE